MSSENGQVIHVPWLSMIRWINVSNRSRQHTILSSPLRILQTLLVMRHIQQIAQNRKALWSRRIVPPSASSILVGCACAENKPEGQSDDSTHISERFRGSEGEQDGVQLSLSSWCEYHRSNFPRATFIGEGPHHDLIRRNRKPRIPTATGDPIRSSREDMDVMGSLES